MVIIAGHLLVEPAEGDAYVDAMRDLVTRARAFDGCIHLAITADSVDPDRTNNIEIWRDARALNRWRAVANALDLAEPTDVRMSRYDASDGGPIL